MRWTSPLLAMMLVASALAFVPTASAACVERVTSYGGVVGMTDEFATDSANSACEPDLDTDTYTERFCVYLWGVDCASLPAQAVELVNFECRWLTGEDCA